MTHTEPMQGFLLPDSETERARGVAVEPAGEPSREPGPGDTVGRYQIRGLLGSGGMGRVFSAFDGELGRVIALKLVRADAGERSSRDRSRLLREAQALARLQHPNVVAVHDVGLHETELFIAMEAIDGPTLGAWLARERRPWRQVLDVFIEAGRGLAAAHDAGIVHRDFKPTNVIVGAHRVVVVDFGVARQSGKSAGDEPDRAGPAPSILDVNLTLTGERVGTPRYMAPEQHLGRPVTPQADQFAFAAALWGALYGTPPFAGRTRDDVLESVRKGPPAPAGRSVPARVRSALAKALALQPGDRWPTLASLLDELCREPLRRPIAAGLGAVLCAAVVVGFAQVSGGPRPAVCARPASSLWDDAARGEVRSAFLGTGAPQAAESFVRVDGSLRARLAFWAQGHADACAASEVRHEQSPEDMQARMACLGRGRDQIAAFVEALRSVDAGHLDRAASEASTIGDLEACANPTALSAIAARPRDPRARASLDALEHDVVRAEAAAQIGLVKQALGAAAGLAERARALNDQPLIARILYDGGAWACESGDVRTGVSDLQAAAASAGLARDDYLATRIDTMLVYCVGAADADFPSGRKLAAIAEASLARAGSPLELRAKLFRAEERLYRAAGDDLNAFGFAELALGAYERLGGSESGEFGRALGDVAFDLHSLGAYRAALAAFERAQPIVERALGPTHPLTNVYLAGLGMAALACGDLDSARRHLERSLAAQRADGPIARNAVYNLARVDRLLGRDEESRRLAERAVEIDRAYRPGHPVLVGDLSLLCRIAVDRRELDQAVALCDEAIAAGAAFAGPTRAVVTEAHAIEAEIALQRHDLAGARRHIETALALDRKVLGPDHPTVADWEIQLAKVLLASGEAPAARSLLERALAIEERARGANALEVVAAQTLLAQSLIATREKARERPHRALTRATRY